jgi:hypothetical protein
MSRIAWDPGDTFLDNGAAGFWPDLQVRLPRIRR